MNTADLVDRHPDAVSACQLQFTWLGRKESFHGPIATVQCFEDNALLVQMLSQPGHGRVMVVDGGGSLRTALLGDVNAQRLIDNGWAGIIINGAVRDRILIDAMALGVCCLGSTPIKSGKTGSGLAEGSVTFGAATFAPGMHVYADRDGILVSKTALTA